MNAQSPLFQIEARRIEAGISREALASAAGLSRDAYQKAISGARAPRATTLGALRAALSRLARVQGASDDLTRLVSKLFNAALALICAREGIATAEVLRHDPARKATSDPAWLRAAHLRAQAIALVNQGLDLPQSELARALNLTPAAVSRAMGKVEDERHRDGALDRWMDEQERMLRGEL